MHLGADAARNLPCARVRRPELLVGVELGHGLADGQRIPHRRSVDEQHGHFPGGQAVCRVGQVRLLIKP